MAYGDPPSAAARLAQSGLLTALVDGLFSSGLSVAFYGSTVQRLFQGVAATLLGPEAFDGGLRTAVIGVLMHIGVAFGWSAVFLVLFSRVHGVRNFVARPGGVVAAASVYGPFVWLVMSLVVIPVLLQRPPSITIRWWVQFFGHMLFVGLPIVASIATRDHHRR